MSFYSKLMSEIEGENIEYPGSIENKTEIWKDRFNEIFHSKVFKDYLKYKIGIGEKPARLYLPKLTKFKIGEDESDIMEIAKNMLVNEFGFPSVECEYDELDWAWWLIIRW